ncbi:MAG: efflux transporter outer membrane subunit [Pseudomonadota bacterium]
MLRNSCLAITALLGGCTVGPDYDQTLPELPDVFVEDTAAPVSDNDMLWQAFDEPELLLLITQARERNTDIAIALATLNEARALAGLQIYSLFPTVTATAAQERTSQSSADPFAFPGAQIAERYRAGFDVSWEIDLFGNLRRQSEGIRRRVEAQTNALYAVELSVVAETAQAYFQWRGANAQIELLEQTLANQTDNLQILTASLEAGRGSALDIARARAEERRIAASLPTAVAARVRAEQRLAVLTGQSVADLRGAITQSTLMPPMPEFVTAGNPVDWLLRRPDIYAAERQLAEATSNVGVRTAALYPTLNLLGSFGWTGQAPEAIGDSGAERWQFAPTLNWRFLDFGRVKQRIREAEAQADGALARFEQTWRLAIEETENALAVYRTTTQTAGALSEAVRQAEEAVRLARLRYTNGADSFLSVLDSERTALSLQSQQVTAVTDRATALAALYKALGGSFAQ